MGYSTENGMYVGKKRIAHASFTANNAGKQAAASTSKEDEEKFMRPKLAVEYNSKIPHALRQRYLDKIIDEFLPKCKSKSEACEEVSETFQLNSILNRESLKHVPLSKEIH